MLHLAFTNLSLALQRICGNVTFPDDNGKAILNHISQSNSGLFGSMDASLKHGRAAHAWIISTGSIDVIEHSNMHLSGAGPVDGYHSYISSSRAELTGITVVSIIAELFREFHNYRSRLNLICDNQGMLQKCANVLPHHFRSHRAANMDLLLIQHSLSSHLQISYNWV